MMKLKLKKNEKQVHQDIVAAVCWAPNNQLFSLSDDKTIGIWDINGEYINKFLDLDTYCTAMEWAPSLKSSNDGLCIGTSNGALRILNRTGKVEKVIEEAHQTATICIKWGSDGQTIASSGEDGQVKVWSRSGVLRTSLVQLNSPVYSLAFSYDENFVLHTSDKHLCIRPVLKGGLKTLTWKAHDEIVLCVDWNYANKLIISGGEDRKYKVKFILSLQIWDQYGRNVYVSSPYNYVITAIAWAPSGEYFAVGSYEMIKLCNRTGWTYSFNKIDSGSIMKLAWSADGTTISGAGVYI
jgi:intraflagellar transport protein 80